MIYFWERSHTGCVTYLTYLCKTKCVKHGLFVFVSENKAIMTLKNISFSPLFLERFFHWVSVSFKKFVCDLSCRPVVVPVSWWSLKIAVADLLCQPDLSVSCHRFLSVCLYIGTCIHIANMKDYFWMKKSLFLILKQDGHLTK